MNWLDVALILGLVAFIWEGKERGIIMEIFEILIITLNPLLCTHLYPFISHPVIAHTIIPALYVNIVSFIFFFAIISMILWVLAGKLELLLKAPPDSSLMQLGGMILGVLKGGIILWGVLFIIGQFHLQPRTRAYYHASYSVRKIQGFSGRVEEAIHTFGSERAYYYMVPRIHKAIF